MPPKKRKIKLPDGREAEVTVVGFQEGGEHWNEYLLQDGSVIRVKLVLGEVMRVEDAYDGEGNPLYLTKFQNVMMVSSPDEIRKK